MTTQTMYTINATVTREQYEALRAQGVDLQMTADVADDGRLIDESDIQDILRNAVVTQLRRGNEDSDLAFEIEDEIDTREWTPVIRNWPFAVKSRIMEWGVGVSDTERSDGMTLVYYNPDNDDLDEFFGEFPQLMDVFDGNPEDAASLFPRDEVPGISRKDELLDHVRSTAILAASVVAKENDIELDTEADLTGEERVNLERGILAVPGIEEYLFDITTDQLRNSSGGYEEGVSLSLEYGLDDDQKEAILKLIS